MPPMFRNILSIQPDRPTNCLVGTGPIYLTGIPRKLRPSPDISPVRIFDREGTKDAKTAERQLLF